MSTATAAFGEQQRAMPWWIPLIEGIALIIVGILLFTNTAATIVILAQILAIYWLISGIMQIVSLFVDRSAWGLKLLAGIIGIWAGLMIIQSPIVGTLALGLAIVVILGIQALILGVINIIQAFRGAGWGIGLLGVVNVIFGIILLGNAMVSAAVLPWVLGGLAIVGGIMAIVMAFRLKST
ncbi:MAG TPA: HdeD family acid-resistance protein [Promineifilum sp.]